MNKENCPAPRLLTGVELERLTNTWDIWFENAGSPQRAIARAKLYLFFLLTRYGALRPVEIAFFNHLDNLDIKSGLLRLKDRSLFLPPLAMRPIRRILNLPEAAEDNFLRLDSGFVRRTFYELGLQAALPQEACAPRAIRYARAREMLELHMPAQNVAVSLGLKNAGQLLQLIGNDIENDGGLNKFRLILDHMETDFRAGRLFFSDSSGLSLQGVFPLQELTNVEPIPGTPMIISINPGLLFPSTIPLPMPNHLECAIISYKYDIIETRVWLKCETGLELLALWDGALFNGWSSEQDKKIDVYIPGHALRICPE